MSLIPRNNNVIADSLATSASMWKIPLYPNKKYEINVKNRPTIPENVQYWQVFQNEEKINNFLQIEEEFINSQIDDQEIHDT